MLGLTKKRINPIARTLLLTQAEAVISVTSGWCNETGRSAEETKGFLDLQKPRVIQNLKCM